MGLVNWWRAKRAGARKKRELAAIDHLRRALEGEEKRLQPILAVVKDIELLLAKGNFEDAERMAAGNLIPMMQQKKLIDQMENVDFGRFRRTILKDMRAKVRELK